MAQQRLQKLLAQAGVASRRAAEELIKNGRVRVNGRLVRELGTRADLHQDRVEVDGRRLVAEKPAYYLLHKPREMVTTLKDPEGRESLERVLERVPERAFPVGRLDYHTSGALLLTNDGEMADALLHPTQGVPKVYIAKMKGNVAEQALSDLRNGVLLDDGYRTAKAEVFVVREDRGNSWLSITIREGKNRQIHRMGEAVGHRVMRLSRSSFAGLSVEGMRPGSLRPLSTKEIDKLKKDFLNPKRRRKHNEKRQASAAENAEVFDEGWGEEVISEPASPSPAAGRAPRGGSGAARPRSSGGGGKPAPRTHPVAQRAVRILETRSIGGAARKETKAAPAKKGAGATRPAAKGQAGGGAPRSAKPASGGARRAAGASRRQDGDASKPAAGARGRGEARGATRGATRGAGRNDAARPAGKAESRGATRGASRNDAARPTGKAESRGATRGASRNDGTRPPRKGAAPVRGAGRGAGKPAAEGAAPGGSRSAGRGAAKPASRGASKGASRPSDKRAERGAANASSKGAAKSGGSKGASRPSGKSASRASGKSAAKAGGASRSAGRSAAKPAGKGATRPSTGSGAKGGAGRASSAGRTAPKKGARKAAPKRGR